MRAEDFRRAVDLLAEMGVFHMALGGGEALERPDFFELASYVRSRGIVPNLTTNGLLLTRETAAKCGIFGQVNVSVDSVPKISGRRGQETDAFAKRARGVDLLLEAGVKRRPELCRDPAKFRPASEVLAFAEEEDSPTSSSCASNPRGGESWTISKGG